MAETRHIDLYEFLVESELQHYYNSIKTELKITNVIHLKYASDEDLKIIGLSRPEIRRLRKFYDKYYPHGYLSKFRRLLQNPRRDDGTTPNPMSSTSELVKPTNSPGKVPSNKHIIPAESICINKQLGTGEFGIVQQGVWTNGAERIQVAIKCLSRERMQSNPMEFLKEAGIMHSIDHENIVRLYGVVLGTESLMLVTELAHLRSLLECLKDSGLRVSFLTVPTLCEFAMQICNGMLYLENKRLIHRDLAARNILVFSKNKVKISDFGLSRALGVGKDYYKTNFNVNLKLPIAWCAPECINYLRFTNASDVWAYGVCLWEMFSYGFQPWAALTGLQILEAIDEPNYQRLEQPECCPREYYSLMLKCWQHDPVKRPKFSDIYAILPDMKPEQLKTIVSNCESKKDHLLYRQGDIVTVLDKCTNSPYWKGVLNSGKTGLFNPANTVAYVEGLPTSNNRDSFCRTSDRQSKRKLRSEMISMPQNDLKHTGHVGLDGAYFGDVAFIASSQNYNQLPRQIVTPYKPSEDIEQTPLLLPPTPTSPDSLQTASGYFPETTSSTNPSFVNSNENTPKHHQAFGTTFDFPPKFNSSNPFAADTGTASLALQNNNYGLEANAFTNVNLEDDSLHDSITTTTTNASASMLSSATGKNVKWLESNDCGEVQQHEYHEISDDEITFGMGPSLLDEINSMFGSMTASTLDSGPKSPDFEHTNKKNEITELATKLIRKNSAGDTNGTGKSKKKSTGTVKAISHKDEKILNHAIEIANEISTRSVNDLVSDNTPSTQSPKRKFSFRFPNLTHHSLDKDAGGISGTHFNGNMNTMTHNKDRKNFSDELKNIPDLQSSITEEHKEAYNSLIERKPTLSLIGKFEGPEFCLASAKTLPKKFYLGRHRSKLGELRDRERDTDMTVPTHQAPRPTTLPHRLRNSAKFDDDSPLKFLKQPPPGRMRASSTNGDDENANLHKIPMDGCSDKESICESPSYLMNSPYTFSERKNSVSSATSNGGGCNSTNNPIPLPPRDRNKTMPTNVKRHVRKHPLIIPGAGLQRTLNKVRDLTPVDDEPKIGFPTTTTTIMSQIDRNLNHASRSNYNTESNKMAGILDKPQFSTFQKLTNHDHDVTAAALIAKANHQRSVSQDDGSNCGGGADKVLYQNIDNLSNSNDNTDCASLHFESILEDNFFKTDNLSSPDVADGFCPFLIQKDVYNKSKEIDFDTMDINKK